MTRTPDILFTAEYIKNILYFATVRQGKVLKNNVETHYFSIDDDLIYENYYSDFGPLNLGCVYKYCSILNDKIKQYLNKQAIVHYTSIEPKKKANSAFLLGCYGVLYLNLKPKDALKPLLINGQSYRPFQDAVQGDSCFTISLIDCLQAIEKARELGFFNFQDFNYEEYDRLDKIQGGDLNWIVPGKFLAFIGPVDYKMSLYHPPEMYIDYFLANDVKIVIRLNKRLYDGNVFNKVGIVHYDLYFHDGSCPPRHILFKFLQICENAEGAIAVHCKAGLGRTGSLIGCYLIKHYRMTSHEAIGWMRICRPGSVIGHQQEWLDKLEPWLLKQGNLFRNRNYQDTEKLPNHEYGLYSIAEKTKGQRPVVFRKSSSPGPPTQRLTRLETSAPTGPQASKVREAVNKASEKNTYDWRVNIQKVNSNQKNLNKGDQMETNLSRRSSAAGEPRIARQVTRDCPTIKHKNSAKLINSNNSSGKNLGVQQPITTFRTSQGPVIRNVNEAKNFLMRSSLIDEERKRQLNSSIKVTPKYTNVHTPNYMSSTPGIMASAVISTGSRCAIQRRRLGRSPSPSPQRMFNEQTRATNTPTSEKFLVKDASKSASREVLSKLKLANPRVGSIGAASLSAPRDAPCQKRAPSVWSDQRPLATQGDLLNSIKLQRRFRDTLRTDKFAGGFRDKMSVSSKDKLSSKNIHPRNNIASRTDGHPEYSNPREKSKDGVVTKNVLAPPRPSSPKGRRNIQTTNFYKL